MRIEGPQATKNGGWLHRLIDSPPRPPAPRRSTPRLRNAADLLGRWATHTTAEALFALSVRLGVSPDSLHALGAVWAPLHEAWAFPMRDAGGEVVGIRLRSAAGRKWAVPGSREGLFYAPTTFGHTGHNTAIIVEGPTDTAAALSIGFGMVVGRPSCSGCAETTKALLDRCGITRIIVIPDCDEPKPMPDGSVRFPGQEGAQKLVQALGRPHKLLLPPHKDLRQWVRAGATRDTVMQAFRRLDWVQPVPQPDAL